ncbi:hypothetical protein BDK51DRAFT_51146 [Blyttiomyces helicus]|uniref:Uncharacterized protein n=1 Tax=Blyttiomyces helicus TaxID=388810 RepID=A0A4P9WBG8_9FUNG|nr:hypothetical protein BDK51DRAFT_51146 [Blyttiomyces helicus]|eukprot:RKO88260.1 hypothetical protein BDK51DRAFT_51146 [Blyttiomyces helicus]
MTTSEGRCTHRPGALQVSSPAPATPGAPQSLYRLVSSPGISESDIVSHAQDAGQAHPGLPPTVELPSLPESWAAREKVWAGREGDTWPFPSANGELFGPFRIAESKTTATPQKNIDKKRCPCAVVTTATCSTAPRCPKPMHDSPGVRMPVPRPGGRSWAEARKGGWKTLVASRSGRAIISVALGGGMAGVDDAEACQAGTTPDCMPSGGDLVGSPPACKKCRLTLAGSLVGEKGGGRDGMNMREREYYSARRRLWIGDPRRLRRWAPTLLAWLGLRVQPSYPDATCPPTRGELHSLASLREQPQDPPLPTACPMQNRAFSDSLEGQQISSRRRRSCHRSSSDRSVHPPDRVPQTYRL